MHEPKQVDPVVQDPKDDMFVACTIASRAQIFVTNDVHLLELNKYRGIQMLRPGEALKLLLSP
jgi:predicted nucleic acid-binding protein